MLIRNEVLFDQAKLRFADQTAGRVIQQRIDSHVIALPQYVFERRQFDAAGVFASSVLV